MKNKIIVIAFAVIIAVLFVLPSSAAPICGTCGDRAYWSYDTRTATLSICGSGEMYDSMYVTPWNEYKEEIRTVFINGVTNVGEFAFYGCASLKTVYLGYTVRTIDYYAFKSCTSLTTVYIPFGVNEIGWSAFENCTALKSVYIPPTLTTIRDWAFAECTALTSITIPNSVMKIGNYAFDGSGLKNVYYLGSRRQWKNVDAGYYNDWLDGVNIICLRW